jgi:hypothetical protein
MNDRAYLNKEYQARRQGDLKHAYDGVQQWAVEVVLMRTAVPDEYVRYQTKLTVQTRIAVTAPFRVTEKFRRASELPQGGTHSCALWNGFIDIMAEMQHEMAKEKGVMVEDEWGKEWELLTQLFADDAHHCASGSRCVEGLEERFEIATLWSAFFGMEHRATKCNATVHSRRRLGKRLGKRLVAGVCTRLGKRLGTCHNSRRHLPSGQATGVCHGVCCKAPAIAPAMQAQAHAMPAPAHAMQAPAHAMGHMPCNRTTRGKMV